MAHSLLRRPRAESPAAKVGFAPGAAAFSEYSRWRISPPACARRRLWHQGQTEGCPQFDMLEPEPRTISRAHFIFQRGDEFLDGAIHLREVGIRVFGLGDRSFVRELSPKPVEHVEHAHAARMAEIASLFVDAEIEEDKSTAGDELAGPQCEVRRFVAPDRLVRPCARRRSHPPSAHGR